MTTEQSEARAALFAELEPLLRDPRQAADGRVWSFCPIHPDGQKSGRRSLSLSPRYGLTCFAGCDFQAIVTALRGRAFDPRVNGNGQRPGASEAKGKLVATYEYRDSAGNLVAEKCRIEFPDGGKTFRWRLPGGIWEDGLGKAMKLRDIPLYGAEVLANASPTEPVIYCEGEKAQRSLVLQGFLAVTHGGGAGTRDFGDSLSALKDRRVFLWPDNDPAGRQYMTVVAARLRDVASSVAFLQCPVALPEKGDAYDYFERGGSAEAIRTIIAEGSSPSEPITELLDDDALVVTIPSPAGPIRFEFSAIETSGRRFDTELEITFGKVGEPFSDRVNLLSSTQRTELRRELDGLYGKEHDWTRLLNKAFGLARKFYTQLDRSLDVADAQTEGLDERFAVEPFLPLDAVTVLFGDGSAGKGMIACKLALEYSTGGDFLGMGTRGQPVLYVDWEDTFQTFARRIRRLGSLPDIIVARKRIQYWPARGIPLAQMVDALKSKIEQDGIGLVIIDSVALACGGPPEESLIANAFFNAVKRLGVTTLCIAHITKLGGEEKKGAEEKPLGSTFWHNSARRTWLVKKQKDDEDTADLDVVMICKKVNDGRKPRPITLRMTFQDPDGAINIRRAVFDVASDLSKASASLNSRIRQALLRSPMTRLELAELLEEKEETIRRTMTRNAAQYVALGGNRWGVSTSTDPMQAPPAAQPRLVPEPESPPSGDSTT